MAWTSPPVQDRRNPTRVPASIAEARACRSPILRGFDESVGFPKTRRPARGAIGPQRSHRRARSPTRSATTLVRTAADDRSLSTEEKIACLALLDTSPRKRVASTCQEMGAMPSQVLSDSIDDVGRAWMEDQPHESAVDPCSASCSWFGGSRPRTVSSDSWPSGPSGRRQHAAATVAANSVATVRSLASGVELRFGGNRKGFHRPGRPSLRSRRRLAGRFCIGWRRPPRQTSRTTAPTAGALRRTTRRPA